MPRPPAPASLPKPAFKHRLSLLSSLNTTEASNSNHQLLLYVREENLKVVNCVQKIIYNQQEFFGYFLKTKTKFFGAGEFQLLGK